MKEEKAKVKIYGEKCIYIYIYIEKDEKVEAPFENTFL